MGHKLLHVLSSLWIKKHFVNYNLSTVFILVNAYIPINAHSPDLTITSLTIVHYIDMTKPLINAHPLYPRRVL